MRKCRSVNQLGIRISENEMLLGLRNEAGEIPLAETVRSDRIVFDRRSMAITRDGDWWKWII